MPKMISNFRRATQVAAAGIAAALVVACVIPASAGPFNWFKGKDQRQTQPQPQPQQGSSSSGRGMFGGLFNGGRSRGPTDKSHSSELPRGNAEVAMIVNPALGLPTLSSRNIAATKAAIKKYKVIVAQGGWPSVPAKALKPGSRGQNVITLHRRLEISGDLVGMSIPNEYDAALAAAVKKFQPVSYTHLTLPTTPYV